MNSRLTAQVGPVRLSPELDAALTAWARAQHCTRSEAIRRVLAEVMLGQPPTQRPGPAAPPPLPPASEPAPAAWVPSAEPGSPHPFESRPGGRQCRRCGGVETEEQHGHGPLAVLRS